MILAALPAPLKGLINALFLAAHSIFWSLCVYALVPIKYLLPWRSWRLFWTHGMNKAAEFWMDSNIWMARLTGLQRGWTFSLPHTPDKNQWAFITSNHQSWTDPLIIAGLFHRKVPFFKVFIKDQLKYMPFLGLVFLALGFPRVKRFSKAKLSKNPHLRGKDIQTTLKCCQKALERPTSILSFIEGTRFTPQKHAQQNSPYQHLLMPKTGGFALTIQALKGHINHFYLVTIIYPGKKSFWDYLCGRVQDVKVDVAKVDIPDSFLERDYQADPRYRQDLKQWLNTLWAQKDKKIQAASPKIGAKA